MAELVDATDLKNFCLYKNVVGVRFVRFAKRSYYKNVVFVTH